MTNRERSINEFELTHTYWRDRNGRLRFGVNAELSFTRETGLETIWGIDHIFISKPGHKEPLWPAFPVPQSLFNIELVSSSKSNITAVIWLNVEEYERQSYLVRNALEKVCEGKNDLFVNVRLDDDLSERIKLRLAPIPCCTKEGKRTK